MTALMVVSMLLVAVTATAVVLTRDPLRQSLVASVFALSLAILFALLQAPDVAMSEVVVGTVFIPGMVLFTLSKVREDD